MLSATAMACGQQPEPDWIDDFVVYQGNIYVISEKSVEAIDKEIGKIDKKISDSKIHSGTISNKYPRGTRLYQIKNIDISESIAIEVSKDEYVLANYKSKYGK